MRRWMGFVAFALLGVAAPACTTHSVGPARTADDYVRKARTTATDALSAVETVLLLAETAAAGRSFATYNNIAISEQEDTLAAVRGDFESIQPPGTDSDALRDELTEILDTAIAHLADVRIAARRGDLGDLDVVAAPLEADASALDDFVSELG